MITIIDTTLKLEFWISIMLLKLVSPVSKDAHSSIVECLFGVVSCFPLWTLPLDHLFFHLIKKNFFLHLFECKLPHYCLIERFWWINSPVKYCTLHQHKSPVYVIRWVHWAAIFRRHLTNAITQKYY